MVFVKDLKKEFYDVLINKRILVLSGVDLDALCTWKILQKLFKNDHVTYTIETVTGFLELEKSYMEHQEGMQYVLFINCGASIDLVEFLQPENGVIFFILDSHRSVDVHNIYNQVQIKLLIRSDECYDIPEFSEVFQDSDESDVENSEDSDDGRVRFDEQRLEKKRERRLWQEKRQQILFNYMEFSDFGTSSCVLVFDLACKMSKDTNDMLWLSIIGVTDSYLLQRNDRDKYIEDIGMLQSHVSRLNKHRSTDDNAPVSVDCLRIMFERDLNLSIYRHWPLIDCLVHTAMTSCLFKVWTQKGEKRMYEFLAEMGLSLKQCRQKYRDMDILLREDLVNRFQQLMEKYNFSESELFIPTFIAHYGFKHKYSSSDLVLAAHSLLEPVSMSSSKDPVGNCLDVLDLLERSNVQKVEESLKLATVQLTAIHKQARAFLDMRQVLSAGPFLYTFLKEGSPDAEAFANPHILLRLAVFTLRAFLSMSRSKRQQNLPMVLGVPKNNEANSMLIVGIPPLNSTSSKNFFGKAFEQAAKSSRCRSMQDLFSTNYIEIKAEDKSSFLDALIALLE